jgi:hypothetical protein
LSKKNLREGNAGYLLACRVYGYNVP